MSWGMSRNKAAGCRLQAAGRVGSAPSRTVSLEQAARKEATKRRSHVGAFPKAWGLEPNASDLGLGA
jgi:hypothetical protein